MLPPGGKDRGGFLIIIVAAYNADPDALPDFAGFVITASEP